MHTLKVIGFIMRSKANKSSVKILRRRGQSEAMTAMLLKSSTVGLGALTVNLIREDPDALKGERRLAPSAPVGSVPAWSDKGSSVRGLVLTPCA